MVFTRLRREFGAPIKFEDRKIDKTKEPYKECASFEDPSFVLKRNEMDTHVQVNTCDSLSFCVIPCDSAGLAYMAEVAHATGPAL